MWIVPEAVIADLLTPEAAFDAVENVFAAMAAGAARNFDVIREALGHEKALYGFKGGFDLAGGALGLKAGGYWPNNLERRGLINHQSAVFLFDPDTGRVRAIVGGNHLTALRTAAASAVSIAHLARADARVIGMIGAGHQSGFQLRAALAHRKFEKVIAWNRSPAALARLEEVARAEGLAYEAVSLDRMVEADVIITITSAFEPILGADCVAPGTHLACMGTDTKGKQEVATELLRDARVFTDEVAQSTSIGEAQHAVAAGLLSAEEITPIGAVLNKDAKGRERAEQVTIFDGTGVGLQDLAVAASLLETAITRGIATEIAF